jgi:hypothetical protein
VSELDAIVFLLLWGPLATLGVRILPIFPPALPRCNR